MDLNLYLLADTTDIRLARLVSQSDHARLPLPELPHGDRLSVSLWLVKSDGTLHALSGGAVATYNPALRLGLRGHAALAEAESFAAADNKWTCTLDLDTDALALHAAAGNAPLALEFRTNTSGVPPTTWCSLDCRLLPAVAAAT